MAKERKKYILALMDEVTLKEAWHARVSIRTFFVTMTLLFLLTLAILSAAVIFTPLRSILPGNTEHMRSQLLSESARIDSLATSLETERQYLNILKQVMAGEISTDTVVTLDSLQIVMQDQLLEAKNEALEDFKAQYETKGKDNLQLFDIRETAPVLTFFRPAHGVVIQHYAPDADRTYVEIQSPDKENITAVLAGTVILTNYEISNTYTMVLQHSDYISVYRGVGRLLKRTGDLVKAGETIGIVSDSAPLSFQLWQAGQPINPEEVIAF